MKKICIASVVLLACILFSAVAWVKNVQGSYLGQQPYLDSPNYSVITSKTITVTGLSHGITFFKDTNYTKKIFTLNCDSIKFAQDRFSGNVAMSFGRNRWFQITKNKGNSIFHDEHLCHGRIYFHKITPIILPQQDSISFVIMMPSVDSLRLDGLLNIIKNNITSITDNQRLE